MGLLDEKIVIVTGAGRGIGRAVARLFAREGARLVLNDSGTGVDGRGADASVVAAVVDEVRAEGGTAAGSADDASTPDGVERIVEKAVADYGGIDVVVCVAGIRADEAFLRTDVGAVDSVLGVTLRGPLLLMQLAARRMIARGRGGRIVLTTGSAGLLGNIGQTAYSAASAGVYGLMRTASIELQRQGIAVNAVSPVAKTRLTEDLPMFEQVESMTPEHVAPAYLYLSSDLASGVTGLVLGVAGGRISLFRLTESQGRFQEAAGGVWTANEIHEKWKTMAKGSAPM